MTKQILDLLFLHDFHDKTQSIVVLNNFKDVFIDKYEQHLTNLFKVELRIKTSQIDLLEALHQAKHEIERFSSLYLWNHNTATELDKITSLPIGFTTERAGLLQNFDTPHLFSLIGNVMVANAARQAACYAYWITKLKPLLTLSKNQNDAIVDAKKFEFYSTFLNEYFAFYMIAGHLDFDTAFSEDTSEEVEKFLHNLRYKTISPEFLAQFLGVWKSKNLQATNP